MLSSRKIANAHDAEKDAAADDARLWNVPLERHFQELASSGLGLSQSDAEARLRRIGANVAVHSMTPPLWRQLLSRLGNPLVLVLLLASLLSAVLGDVTSFVLVVTIVAASVLLDLIQERKAHRAVEALRAQVAVSAHTLRDGQPIECQLETIVPGDVVLLSPGDLVPGDCRLIETNSLFVDEALLTGEAYPAEKRGGDLATPAATPDSAINTAFMGTSVISGTAKGLVIRTGTRTILGNLAAALAAAPPPTAFERGVRQFGLLILQFTIFLVLFVLAVNVLFHRPWLVSLMFALALAVGLTPELLPMVVTVTLTRGAMRLAAKRVIVKRIAAMHNLGAMDTLCTDKTGTLTEAKIRLVRTVDGAGADSLRVFELAYLNSRFAAGIHSPLDDAILGYRDHPIDGWSNRDEVPFDFERRRVSVLLARGTEALFIVKGAPEDLLRCATQVEDAAGTVRLLDDAARQAITRHFVALGEEGNRALAVAWRKVSPERRKVSAADEAALVFGGYAVFLDPPKESATRAIHALSDAGIAVKILTGDTEQVTRHVCSELGLPVDGVLTGAELAVLSDDALLARLDRTQIFCRVTPQQKLRLLLALQRRGDNVGFLGDGINDAAALHAADIGISVDSAVDVAKNAADLILLDRDLSVIHEAVVEGRRSVANVIKYILMGASSNFGNMFSMAGAALFLPFLPMLPAQVLLNNLLYDLSEVGVPFDRVDPEAVARPIHWDLGRIRTVMLALGPVSSLFDFLTFFVLIQVFHAGERLFQTGWFVESLATQALVVFIIRTARNPLRSRPHPILLALSFGVIGVAVILPLTPGGRWLGFVRLPPVYYGFLVAAVILYLCLAEVTKRIVDRRRAATESHGKSLRRIKA